MFGEFRRWAERNETAPLRAEVADLRAELTAVRDELAREKAAREKAAGRAWAVVPNVVGALVNGGIAAAVAYFVAHR